MSHPYPQIALRLFAFVALVANLGAVRVTAQEDACAEFYEYAVSANGSHGEAADFVTCCDAFRPRWLASGSVIYMDRATQDTLVLMQNTTNPSEQLNANDFNFAWSAGVDATLMKRYWDDSGIELRFVGLDQLDARANIVTNAASLELLSDPPVFLPDVRSIAARYTTDLLSFEANYRCAIDETLTYLLGFRYIGVDDDLTAVLDSATQSYLYRASTRNDLYGMQVGVIGSPCTPLWGCLLTSGFAKVGVFGNAVQHESFLDSGVAQLPVEGTPDRVSWMGELGVSAQLPITHHISVVGGYGMMWFERIAIGSDQMSASDFFNGIGTDNRGGTVFHGANLGVVLQR